MKLKVAGSFAALLMGTTFHLHAAAFNPTWQPPENSGTHSWGTASSWSGGAVPNNAGTNYYGVVVSSTGGAQTLSTSGTVSISRLSLNVSDGGSLLFRLGGNLTVLDAGTFTQKSSISNTTSSAGNLTIDLNGYNFTVQNAAVNTDTPTASNYTIASSSSVGGVYSQRQVSYNGTNRVNVQNNVTIEVTANVQNDFRGWSFSDASSVRFAAQSTTQTNLAYLPTAGIGNLIIGVTGNTQKTTTTIVGTGVVHGDVVVNSFQGASGGAASELKLYQTSASGLIVGGDFTDYGTDAFNYGNGRITFDGYSGETQQVSIARTGLTTHFKVGDGVGKETVVELGHNLTTTGELRVAAGATLDLNGFTATGGSVIFDNSSVLSLALDLNEGFVLSSGALTVGNFSITLADVALDWQNGDNLLLFGYEGAFSGSLNLTGVTADFLFTHGGIYHDIATGNIYLSNVSVIPEPSSVILIAGGLLAGALIRRRYRVG